MIITRRTGRYAVSVPPAGMHPFDGKIAPACQRKVSPGSVFTGDRKTIFLRRIIECMEEYIATIFEKKGISMQITCSQAWTIAEKLGISKQEIGAYGEANKIEIRECQLGCF